MSQSPYIYDVTADTFDRYVLENSFHKPVLVDFWADWCAPCKALMPVLAKLTEEFAGELLLAKVDCDAEAALTERFGIRSLPTVVLFKDGQPVDGFAGVQPESAIRTLLEPHVTAPEPAVEADEAPLAEQARHLIDTADFASAIALLQPAISQQPEDELLILLAQALAGDGQLEEAEAILPAVKDKEAHKRSLAATTAQITFLRKAADYPPRETLEQRLVTDPKNSEARFQLAILDLARHEPEAALQTLLELFQTDRTFADGSPQQTLLQVFDLLGGDHPLTTTYRRRMYQALY